jgi:protein TonB
VRVAGTFLSGIGHAGVIGLAAIGPPFLWAPPDRPVAAVAVSLLSPADLAALVPRPPAPAPPRSPPPSPPPAASPKPMPPPLVPAPKEAPPPAATTLAPGFDAAAPLGVEAGAPGGEGELAPEAETDPEAVRADWAARVQRAVRIARIYPEVARARGLEGRVTLQLVLATDGRLLASQLIGSSGAMSLDRAALETVRRAKYPPLPAGLEAERTPVMVEVVFAGSDR